MPKFATMKTYTIQTLIFDRILPTERQTGGFEGFIEIHLHTHPAILTPNHGRRSGVHPDGLANRIAQSHESLLGKDFDREVGKTNPNRCGLDFSISGNKVGSPLRDGQIVSKDHLRSSLEYFQVIVLGVEAGN